MTYPTTYQDMERILLHPPAAIEPEPTPETPEPDMAADAPPVPDFEEDRSATWIDTARAALFIETGSEGGEPE